MHRRMHQVPEGFVDMMLLAAEMAFFEIVGFPQLLHRLLSVITGPQFAETGLRQITKAVFIVSPKVQAWIDFGIGIDHGLKKHALAVAVALLEGRLVLKHVGLIPPNADQKIVILKLRDFFHYVAGTEKKI